MAGPISQASQAPARTLPAGAPAYRSALTLLASLSFLLTAACELYVLFHALWGAKPSPAASVAAQPA